MRVIFGNARWITAQRRLLLGRGPIQKKVNTNEYLLNLFLLLLFFFYFVQTLYNDYFLSVYNVCFTSLPVLAMGIFDQVRTNF